MAPHRTPRSSLNLEKDKPRRSRNSRFLEDSFEQDGSIEVPYYLVAPKASSKRELMKRASILKSGTTGYGCPLGYSGVISYPLSEKELALLNSMGGDAIANGDVHANGVAAVANGLQNNPVPANGVVFINTPVPFIYMFLSHWTLFLTPLPSRVDYGVAAEANVGAVPNNPVPANGVVFINTPVPYILFLSYWTLILS